MRHILISFLTCFSIFSANAHADSFEPKLPRNTVDIDFRQITIPELLNAVLKDMLKKNFLLSPDLVTDTRKITVQIKSIPTNQLLPVFTAQAAGLGLSVTEKNGVLVIGRKTAENSPFTSGGAFSPELSSFLPSDRIDTLESDILQKNQSEKTTLLYKLYKPKYRSITYLAKLAKFTGVNHADIDDSSSELVLSHTDAERLDKAVEILTGLDTQQQGITIKAAIIEYSKSDDSARSLSGVLSLLAGKIGVAYTAGASLSNSISFKGKTLQAVISAIDGDSSFKYLAEPTLRVLSGEKAKLTVGSEVPIRGNSVVDKNGNTVQSVEYKTAGVQFEVMPKIQGDSIILYVNQQISNFGNTTTSNIDSPTLFKRQAETTIDTKRGSLIMMAGLDDSKTTNTSSGIAFLPKFLHSKNNSNSKSQILLLIEVLNEPVLNTPML